MLSDTPLVAVLGFEFALTAALAYLTWERRRRSAAAVPLFAILVLTGVWQTATIGQLLSTNRSAVVFFFHLGWIAESPVAVPWLVFSLYLTGREESVSTPRVVALFLPYIGLAAAAMTSPIHGLYFTNYAFREVAGAGLVLTVDWGPLFWVTILYGYSLISIGVLLIVEEFLSSPAYRKPIVVLLVGVLIAWLGTATHIAGVVPAQRFNPAVYLMVLVVLSWYVALFHMNVLRVLPVARDKLLEVMETGVLVADSTGRVVDTNPAAVGLLGLDADDPGGRDLPALFEPYLEDPWALLGDEPVVRDIVVEDGGARHLQVRSRPVRSADIEYGEVEAGYLLLVRDLTPIRERERELERRNEQLDRFAGAVSHDLRNPLTVALGNVGFARKQVEDDDTAQMLGSAEDALNRMNDLIDDVLTLAREGEAVENPSVVSLDRTVGDAWGAVDTPAATLDTDLGNVALLADSDQLQRVLENLFRNAVEHGGEDVTVTVGTTPDGFYVADDGPGIPAEDRGAVFDSDYTTGGHGLGLEIVETIVEAHGWEVTAGESESGGARFDVTGVEFE